ncbi:glycosyltransferase family 2 protein [Gordonia tangerina]|uniref:4,4'-diaponeurosporenoate glycosyltransferase n=1 Tax=Gordonia tangerina TaxID=2911060 RepID=A0ABS9DL78_9ACTN|nr:glycosyltransferase family 2 protein [Gordonia tangerina]MCF3939994.1 glycosyltransferase [Gordonia tangerina]
MPPGVPESTDAPRPTLSVVVPAYNEEESIAECLGRLVAQPEITEIVVVDNNSTDRSRQIVDSLALEHTRIHVVTEPRQGLVFARNRGLDAATGDLIARIDADTRVGPTWAQTIIDFFTADTARSWSALCGRGEAYGVPLEGRFDRWKIRVHPLGRRQAHRAVTEIPVLYGSNMVLRREVWATIRTRVSMRRDIFEDVDMGLCVTESGGRNAFLASLTVGVSSRRMETGLMSFVTYMSFLPRTFALHRRVALAAGTALVYVPALTVVHAMRLVAIRLYDDETGRFSTSPRQLASDRVLP